MSGARHWEQDKDSTLYVGNLDERCTDALVWELMTQAGVVINVHLPKDRVTQIHQGYGFVEFASEDDADYAAKIMNQIRLHGKPIRVNKASADKRGGLGEGGLGGTGVGAEIFVGNLDTMVDEKVLFETFSRFGPLIAPPKVARDDNNLSKGYGFVSYASFEASDDAIANMHGQYLMNKEITVQYAYKKDGKGERHGDAAERALAAQAKAHGVEVAIPAMPAALVMPTPAVEFTPNMPPQRPPQAPPAYNYPFPGNWQPPPGGPPMGAPPQMPAAPRQYMQTPLQAAPGLPPRPPPSMAGYGGPTNAPGMGQGFQGMPGYPPPGSAPGLPPAGIPPPAGPPGMLPPGLPQPPVGGFRPPGISNGFPPPGQQR